VINKDSIFIALEKLRCFLKGTLTRDFALGPFENDLKIKSPIFVHSGVSDQKRSLVNLIIL
jgi:hypothetical protein